MSTLTWKRKHTVFVSARDTEETGAVLLCALVNSADARMLDIIYLKLPVIYLEWRVNFFKSPWSEFWTKTQSVCKERQKEKGVLYPTLLTRLLSTVPFILRRWLFYSESLGMRFLGLGVKLLTFCRRLTHPRPLCIALLPMTEPQPCTSALKNLHYSMLPVRSNTAEEYTDC